MRNGFSTAQSLRDAGSCASRRMLLAILSNSKLLGDHLHDLAQYKPAEVAQQNLVTTDKARVILKRCCNAVGWMAARDNEYSVSTVFS